MRYNRHLNLCFYGVTKSMQAWSLDPRCKVSYRELRLRIKACYRQYKTVDQPVREMPSSILESSKPDEGLDPWGAKFRILKEGGKRRVEAAKDGVLLHRIV